MNTSLVKKWVQELRSGRYEQGFGLLRGSNDRFCCLGVLCDVAGAEWAESGYRYDATYQGQKAVAYLPPRLARRAGVNKELEYELTRRNDQQASFESIADIIEKRLLWTEN